ncbi:MAG TPA: hypothetical protein VMY35_14420 [Phycisphaerae bacterium]|nr:hypothetical protein [Phycisphaerae bacterium]
MITLAINPPFPKFARGQSVAGLDGAVAKILSASWLDGVWWYSLTWSKKPGLHQNGVAPENALREAS